MKQILAISALTVAVSFFSSCKNAPSPQPSGTSTATDSSENIEQTIRQMENNWLDAVKKNDPAAVDRLLGDDFIVTGWDGQTTSKAQILEQMKAAPKGEGPAPDDKVDD